MKTVTASFVLIMVFLCLATKPVFAQMPSFDVGSVKPNKLGGPPRRIGTEGNRFLAENVPLVLLIQLAYGSGTTRLLREHVIGGPGWINTERFDIEARADISTRFIPTGPTWLMVRSLLEDRFKLKVHREVRQLPVYDLVVAKDGIKIKMSADQTPPASDDQTPDQFDTSQAPPRGEAFTMRSTSGEMIITGTAIGVSPNLETRRPHSLLSHGLTTLLSPYAGRTLIDKTNLTGLYDFRVQFSSAFASPDALGVSIFTAVEEQLGLKLVSSRGSVEVLIIDSVERPSEN